MAELKENAEFKGGSTSLELAGSLGGSVVRVIGLAAIAALGVGLLLTVGLLSEQILGAFSVSAGLKFESVVGSWLGRHFLDMVKVVLWTTGLGGAYSVVAKSQRKWLLVLAIGVVVGALGFFGLTTWRCPLVVPLLISVLVLAGTGLRRSKVLTLARRELNSWLLGPMGYVVAAGFAIMAGRMFVASMAELGQMRPDNPMAIQPLASFVASNFFAVALLILVAVISMRLVAGERERGTMDLLCSLPLKDWEIILGKFLGGWGFFCLVVLVTSVHMGLYGAFGDLDWMQVFSSYIGLGLIGMAFVAVGLFCSSLVRNQIVAGLLVFLTLGVTIFLSDIVSFVGVGTTGGGWTEYTSLLPHLDWASRGTIDSRTVFAMVSTCGLALFLAFCTLRATRQGIFWNVFESYSSTHWINLLAGLALAAGTLVFLTTNFQNGSAVKLAALLWSGVLMGLAWAPICRSRLAGSFSLWRFMLAVAAAPAVVAVGLVAGWYFEDSVRPVLAVLIAIVIAALAIPRCYGGQLKQRLIAMGNIVVALVCVVMINVTGNYLAIKHHEAIDISTGQAFSLSAEAKKIFQDQVKDGERVDVYCIVSSSSYAGQHDAARRNLLERELRIFAEAVNHPGNVKLAYQFLDPTEDDGQIGQLINRYDVMSNRQVLLVYRNRQYILDDRDMFELFPDMSRMAELRASWRTTFERMGAMVSAPPKTDEDAYKWLASRPQGVLEQFENYLALRSKGDFQKVLTEGILRLVQDKIQLICFTTGHGEASPLGGPGGSSSAGGLRRLLRQNNYAVEEIGPLTGQGEIPEDCSLLVVMGPGERFAAEEVAKIEAYLAGGGRVMALINPGHDGGLGRLFGKYGIKSPDNQALAYNQQGQVENKVFLPLRTGQWQQLHPVVEGAWLWAEGMGRRGIVLAEGVRQVRKDVEAQISGYLITELLNVPQGYLASEDTGPNPKRTVGKTRGPYPFAVVAEKLLEEPADEQPSETDGKESVQDVDQQGDKLLVIGDADMFSDKEIVQGQDFRGSPVKLPLFRYPGGSNEDLALMAVGYMAGVPAEMPQIEKEQPKVYVTEDMKLAYGDLRPLTSLVLWLILPGTLLLLGLGVWIARRSY